MPVANLGSLDWTGDHALDLSATWQTTDGSWTAAARSFELRSGDSGRVTFETIVPTGTDQGTLTLELVRWDGVPFSVFGSTPVSVALAFLPPAPPDAPAAPQK